MSDLELPELRDAINRGLDDGGMEITKRALSIMSNGDLALVLIKLREWEFKGLLQIVANPVTAGEDEVCVRMLDYIDQKSPWPNFPIRQERLGSADES